ncbi:hypothetical protein GO730_29870 [Spirosoma sp. HMF3257]|uniref:glycosyltransferase n=1 Tax=Spirosoma telluris TaxID=2183553 RepID=UPI0011B94564|nr:hypothetical protein [Spirosoma telluris]
MLKGSQTEVVVIQTMLSTYNEGVLPPLNTGLIPGQDSPQTIQGAWKRYYRNRALWRAWQTIKYIGQNPDRLVRRKFRQNNLLSTYRLRDDKVFHVGFDNLPEWIMAPREFDFPERQVLSYQKYLGVMVDLTRTEDLPPTYLTLMERIAQERQANLNLKLLYVSLGTVKGAHAKTRDLQRFFKRLFEAVGTQPHWQVIIAVGPDLKDSLTKCPSNIYMLAWVPQLHLLQHCDLFITHGGLNSVLEGWTLEVPMLVYPLNYAWDQMGNAARVVSQGKGLLGDFRNDSAGRINQAIRQLLIKCPICSKIQ